MIKCLEFGNRSFETKEEMFSALKASEHELISLKKAQVFKSCEKGQLGFLNLDRLSNTTKADFVKEDYIYPVISTTNYLDTHGDCHFNGCFGKTVKEQQGKVMYALDHDLKYNSILAWQKDVNMFIQPLDWSFVGKSYLGQTEALIFEIPKEAIRNKQVLADIEAKASDFENSIRMVYHKIRLAVDSREKEFTENKAYFDSRINSISNKEIALEKGYFWGVEELGIHKEGSLVVAGGSNDATSIITLEAADSTSDIIDPSKGQSKKSYWEHFTPIEKKETVWEQFI